MNIFRDPVFIDDCLAFAIIGKGKLIEVGRHVRLAVLFYLLQKDERKAEQLIDIAYHKYTSREIYNLDAKFAVLKAAQSIQLMLGSRIFIPSQVVTKNATNMAMDKNLDRLVQNLCKPAAFLFADALTACRKGYPALLDLIINRSRWNMTRGEIQQLLSVEYDRSGVWYMNIHHKEEFTYWCIKKHLTFDFSILWDKEISNKRFYKLMKIEFKHVMYGELMDRPENPMCDSVKKLKKKILPSLKKHIPWTPVNEWKFSKVGLLVYLARKYNIEFLERDKKWINVIAYPKVIFPGIEHPITTQVKKILKSEKSRLVDSTYSSTTFNRRFYELFRYNLCDFRNIFGQSPQQYDREDRVARRDLYDLHFEGFTFQEKDLLEALHLAIRKTNGPKIYKTPIIVTEARDRQNMERPTKHASHALDYLCY